MENFPDDENGVVLREMALSGDDLSKSRKVDFSLVFADKKSAKDFCAAILHENPEFECIGPVEESSGWDVTVTTVMVPSHDAITYMEEYLAKISLPLAGKNDGWGCFAVQTK